MPVTDAERHFQSGLGLLARRRYADAAVRFEAAIIAERQAHAVRPQMRYRSYFALSRSLAGSPTIEDVRICEEAAARDHFDPVLLLNLGQVYLRTGKTTRALLTFRRGLELEPTNEELRRAFASADRRRPPPIGALGREHPLNRSLGRLRARFGARRAGPENGSG